MSLMRLLYLSPLEMTTNREESWILPITWQEHLWSPAACSAEDMKIFCHCSNQEAFLLENFSERKVTHILLNKHTAVTPRDFSSHLSQPYVDVSDPWVAATQWASKPQILALWWVALSHVSDTGATAIGATVGPRAIIFLWNQAAGTRLLIETSLMPQPSVSKRTLKFSTLSL